MVKKQSSKNTETSSKKIDPTVLVAIIGGAVTIIVTLITVVIPLIFKQNEAAVAPTQGTIIGTPALTSNLLSFANNNLNDVQVLYIDDFENISKTGWAKWSDLQSASVDNSALILTGSPKEDAGFARNNLSFVAGQGFLLQFKFNGDPNDKVHFSFGLSEMNEQSPQAQGFHIFDDASPYTAAVDLHFNENDDSTQDLSGASLKIDTWYGLLMVVGPKAELLTSIWDLDNPINQIRYQEPSGNPDWVNLSWYFEYGLPKEVSGSLYIKDFTQISFNSVK